MNTDLHTLTGAYAVDALDALERSAFQAHLSECDSCTEEVMGLRATSAVLGVAVAVTPDEEFRRRLMSQVRNTRQQAPLAGSETGRVLPLLRRARTTSRALLAVAAALVVLAVIMSRSKASAVFVGQSMPDVGRERALQLWVLGDGNPRSVGLLNAAAPIVAHGVKPGLRLGVTVEPAGGSRQPTTTPIMQVDLV